MAVWNGGACWLAFCLLFPSLAWVVRDRQVWSWDPSWYGEVSTDLWWSLRHESLHAWLLGLENAFAIKSPGIAWLGEFFVPLGQFLGSMDAGLMLSVLSVQFASLLLLFKIGRKLAGGGALGGCLLACVVAVSPLFTGLSHQYFSEPLQTLGVVWIYWVAAEGRGWSRLRTLAHLGIGASIALLAKASAPLYCLGPGVIGLIHAFRAPHWREDRAGKFGLTVFLLAGAAALMGATATWYAHNFESLSAFVRSTSGGSIALNYGHPGPLFAKLVFWLRSARSALFVPAIGGLFALAAIGSTASLLKGPVPEARRKGQTGLLASVAAAHCVAVLALFSVQVNEESRYLLPAIPGFAIVFTYLCARPGRAFWLAAGLALAAAQFVFTQAVAFGRPLVAAELSPWLLPANPDPGREREIAKLVYATSESGKPGRYVVNGCELPWINANSLSFYAAQQRLDRGFRAYFTSLGYAEGNPETAWRRLGDLHALYFVSLDAAHQPQPPDFLNKTALPILQRVGSNSDFMRMPFESDLGILVYRRR